MTDATLAHIVFVLDRSGSMDPLRRTAVEGFNRFLAHPSGSPVCGMKPVLSEMRR